AREILLDAEAVRRARPAIKRLSEHASRFLIEDLEQGIHPPGIEAYLVLFSERPSMLLDHLPRGATVISPDTADVDAAWERLFAEYEKGYRKACALGRAYPPPEAVIVPLETVHRSLESFPNRVSTSTACTTRALSCSPASAHLRAGKGADALFDSVVSLMSGRKDIFIFSSSDMFTERIAYALSRRGVEIRTARGDAVLGHEVVSGRVRVVEGDLSSGFVLEEAGIALIGAQELLGARRRRRRGPSGPPIYDPFTQLNVGDPVVHRDNGIGIFQGVVRLEVDGTSSDYVLLEYLGGDRLYVPVYRLGLLQRYVGDADHYTIDRLGGTRWITARAKAGESVAKLAAELLELHARRQAARGVPFDTASPAVEEFADAFPYTETDDQLKAVEETLADMSSPRPMDRLICGDVGYGKTEVALRAAFVAAMSGKQVAVLVPTTLLAHQHLKTFRERMGGWPIRVEALLGTRGSVRTKAVMDDLAAGKIDIVIGTHALLSDKVVFRDLGLLVIDEEHRFGVRHKELIKAKRAAIDVLTLTATPIPRTLNLAISGLRELSVIETPPVDRKAVDTTIARFDDDTILEAVNRELDRGGQVFFVHNEVSTIEAMARHIQALCTRARVGVAHGQMPRARLDHVMEAFIDRRVTLLVTSAIISSGIDIPNANTIIIDRADKFGLADLYQLRGRVGRSKTKGYCVLLLPQVGQITKDARRRLAAIKEYESLGAGFHMAMRDMEIRGVGDILGRAQWGHVTAIGYELYQEMLTEAVAVLRGEQEPRPVDPEILIGVDAYVPEDYCPDQHLRLGLYRRLFGASAAELPEIALELEDLYGPMPEPVRALLGVSEIRDIMKRRAMKKVEVREGMLRLWVSRDSILNLEALKSILQGRHGRLRPEGVIEIPLDGSKTVDEVKDILYALE
ncbi:MAG TPA: transcription-repair coupling factor, partial [Deltaproteobacteria bacterium]|nr:transcription-repair coupling factor [Deltaproteobacteria bacterium]